MAWRAGCRVANMEFIQFHPTCLYHPQAKSFLISEAVRGEGGRLLLPDGSRFMPRHDARGELAPRDVVARAIDFEMKKRGLDCVYLDISHKPAAFLAEHFPNILARCPNWVSTLPARRSRSSRPRIIPVAASSATCVHAPISLASTSPAKLPAPACTGPIAWPATRCSNAWYSLKRRPVTSCNSLQAICHRCQRGTPAASATPTRRLSSLITGMNCDASCGITSASSAPPSACSGAQNRVRLLAREIDDFYSHFRVSHDLIELRNLVVTADLIIRCALRRHESRGLHFSRNYPETLPRARNTVIRRRPRRGLED
jgi:L-aspartate oxidase